MARFETQTADSHSTESFLDRYAEAQRYFMGEGTLNAALEQLVADLKNHGIDYAVIGAVALFAHGYERFTENINLLLTAEGLEKFRKELLGRGGWGLGGYDQTESARRVRAYPFGITIEIHDHGRVSG